MKLMIQRLSSCTVVSGGTTLCKVGRGLLCFVGFHMDDKDGDVEWISRKATSVCFWPDDDGKPWKRGVIDIDGDIVVVVEPGLIATCDGDRPSTDSVLEPSAATPVFARLVSKIQALYKVDKVHAIPIDSPKTLDFANDGPVTFTVDSFHRRD